MDVIATQKGLYDRVRERGDLFTIRDAKADFSEVWMAKPGTDEAKAAIADKRRDQTVTPEQVAAEVAAATGRSSADKARIAELESRLAAMEAATKPSKVKGDDNDGDAGGARGGDAAGGGVAGAVGGDDPDGGSGDEGGGTTVRRTRHTRA